MGLVPGGIHNATADGFQVEEPALGLVPTLPPPPPPVLLAGVSGDAGGNEGSPAWLASSVNLSTCRTK